MIIIHCLRKTTWETYKNKAFYGESYIATEGFIHCSEVETFSLVAPNFANITDSLVLLCIDTTKISSEIKWECDESSGIAFPHIYGLLNISAVVNVLPFLRDVEGTFILNPELQSSKSN
ncbi:hypothetical protein FACS1894111_09130 [Clostridia bacterium]|nr:hypothetical protein FACS1894111_09130 [Clostridia bacterium]